MRSNKFIIGTASFANQYGLRHNTAVVRNRHQADSIARTALELGVKSLDTAPSYGSAESLIGSSEMRHLGAFSKFSSKKVGSAPEEIYHSVVASLARLRKSALLGLTFHRSTDLLGNASNCCEAIMQLKTDGLIESWGVSVYDPEELYAIFELNFLPDYIQAPVNVLDHRFVDPELQSHLKANRISTQARSVFLQGLLLDERYQKAKPFLRWNSKWVALRNHVTSSGLSAAQFCFGFVDSLDAVSGVVVGVNSPSEMGEILDGPQGHKFDNVIIGDLATTDKELIDPRRWSHG